MARARDLAANSPYVSGAIEKICDNVVFNGIRSQFVLTRGGVSDRDKARELEKLYKKWAKACGHGRETGIGHPAPVD